MINSFDKFLNERYGQFQDSIKYTNWNNFKDKLINAINIGFNNEKELVDLMGMDFNKYTQIRENMIYNWKDSVSKSLLHSISEIGQKIPKDGSNIFKDLRQQTAMLVVASGGLKNRDMFGNINDTSGINLLNRHFDLSRIKNTDPKNKTYDSYLKKDVMKKFVDFGGVPAYTVKPEAIEKVNEMIQYIWLYSFYHHYKMKKDSPKLPKFLYRGIRVFQLKGKDIEELRKISKDTKHDVFTKNFIDNLIDYIVKNGISKISDGKLLSFTESRNIAAYFANGEGIILRVDPSKVKIVTSPKTEEFFQEADYVSGKKEKEYIIKIPTNYKFTKEDIEIVNKDYWVAGNNPLAVQFFDHDNKKAIYKLNGVNIKAKYIWHSNTNGGLIYYNLDDERSWGDSRRAFKQKYGFDPMPTEKNIDQIKDFVISNDKGW